METAAAPVPVPGDGDATGAALREKRTRKEKNPVELKAFFEQEIAPCVRADGGWLEPAEEENPAPEIVRQDKRERLWDRLRRGIRGGK